MPFAVILILLEIPRMVRKPVSHCQPHLGLNPALADQGKTRRASAPVRYCEILDGNPLLFNTQLLYYVSWCTQLIININININIKSIIYIVDIMSIAQYRVCLRRWWWLQIWDHRTTGHVPGKHGKIENQNCTVNGMTFWRCHSERLWWVRLWTLF